MKRLTPARFAAVLFGLLMLLAISASIGVALGPSGLDPERVLNALRGSPGPAADADIVLRIRLPRVVLAMLVGASLSVAGVIFQALLRNPLADPFILGVSGGAALGGICVLALGGAVGLG